MLSQLILKIIFLNLIFFSMHINALTSQEAKKVRALINDDKIITATKRINALLVKYPNHPKVLFLQGFTQAKDNNTEAAIDTYENLVKNFPEYPEPFNNLAVLYANNGDLDLAISTLEKAIESNMSYSTAYLNLGDLYAKKAAAVYSEALKIDKKNSIAKNKLKLIDDFFNYRPTNIEGEIAKKETEKIDTRKDIKNDKARVAATINNWKKGWENKNFDLYFGLYSSLFKTPDNLSITQWEENRRNKIQYKKKIKITIENLNIYKKQDLFYATFIQKYESDDYSEKSMKMLTFSQENNEWKIIKEISN